MDRHSGPVWNSVMTKAMRTGWRCRRRHEHLVVLLDRLRSESDRPWADHVARSGRHRTCRSWAHVTRLDPAVCADLDAALWASWNIQRRVRRSFAARLAEVIVLVLILGPVVAGVVRGCMQGCRWSST